MKRHPAGAGCDDDPRWRWDRRRGDEPERAVVVPFSCRRLNSPFGSLRRSENASDGLKRSLRLCPLQSISTLKITNPFSQVTVPPHLAQGCPKWAELGTEAAETLRSPSGGVPAARGEAAATSERSERERQAVRFAVEAVCCGVVGCQRSEGLLRVETSDGPRVLCPAHLRRWGQ